MSPEAKPTLGPRGVPTGASSCKLFLDFQSMKIIHEDADQDSASDLSDSERVPVAPSPLTPPELNLRAEEIDPLCFDLPLCQGQVEPEYQYPDFLPPPLNSWNLRDMAELGTMESRAGAAMLFLRPGGTLGRFVDRLVRLEWLQEQTLQWERSRGTKGRATPGSSTPGKGRHLAAALTRPHGGTPRLDPSCKKDWPRRPDLGASPSTLEPCLQTLDMPMRRRACTPKSSANGRAEEKKRKPSKGACFPRWDLPRGGVGTGGGDSRLESSDNLRAPRPHVGTLDAADSKVPRAQTHASLKKKGGISHSRQAPPSNEKKLRPNGVKPTASGTPRFK